MKKSSDNLKERIAAAIDAQERKPRVNPAEKYNQLTLAWRMTLELVVGTALGAGLGWGLDILFATTPVFVVIFGILGFIAGVKTVIRSANEVARRSEDQSRGDNGDKTAD